MTDAKGHYNRKKWACRYRTDRLGNPIQFLLTYEEWSRVWLESGHWGEWGQHRGDYVMSRRDDIGDYVIGNVFIQTVEQNIAEANRRRVGALNPRFGKEVTEKHHAASRVRGREAAELVQTCPHCGMTGKGLNMLRWHLDRCKHASAPLEFEPAPPDAREPHSVTRVKVTRP